MGEIILSDREVEEAKGRTVWERVEEFVFGNRWVVVLGLLGLILLGGGVFFLRAGIFEGTKVELIETEIETEKEVVVEIAGEVIKPGVYKLEATGRVEDLLVAAGGLAGNADREWVEKNLNRAARLLDGQKVYVPALGESLESTTSIKGTTSTTGLININTASQAQLDTLWQIGPARASAIIDGRPFSSVEELLSKKVIPSNVFERIKDEITAP